MKSFELRREDFESQQDFLKAKLALVERECNESRLRHSINKVFDKIRLYYFVEYNTTSPEKYFMDGEVIRFSVLGSKRINMNREQIRIMALDVIERSCLFS